MNLFQCRAAGPNEDTRTGPNQVLRHNKVPRTGLTKYQCLRRTKNLVWTKFSQNRSLEKKIWYELKKFCELYGIIFSVCAGWRGGLKIGLNLNNVLKSSGSPIRLFYTARLFDRLRWFYCSNSFKMSLKHL